jgi:hypothetical protein
VHKGIRPRVVGWGGGRGGGHAKDRHIFPAQRVSQSGRDTMQLVTFFRAKDREGETEREIKKERSEYYAAKFVHPNDCGAWLVVIF